MELPQNYNYHKISEEIHRIHEVKDQESAEVWLKEYSLLTKSTWRVARTYPSASKCNIFKRDYRCCHNTDRRVHGIRSTKHTGCQAKLRIIVKKFIKICNNPDPLTEEYPCIVRFTDKHNHDLDSAASLKHRDLCPTVKEKFLLLFQAGHTVASALKSYKAELMQQFCENYSEVESDGRFMPTYSEVNNMFKREFSNMHGEESVTRESLQSLLLRYKETNGGSIAEFWYTSDERHYFVVLCTPLMMRAHENLTHEVLTVEAVGGVGKHRLYFLVTPCATGGLPLGVIITDTDDEETLLEALKCLKRSLPPNLFNSKIQPRVILTDNDPNEISALKKIFPQSKFLLCQFRILKSFWSWLNDPKHQIQKEHRQELYLYFRSLLYTPDETMAKNILDVFVLQLIELNYRCVILHLSKLMKIKKTWMALYRKKLPFLGGNTTHYVEPVFRVLKDTVFERITASNLSRLVDFIVMKYDAYMRLRLVDFCQGQHTTTAYRHTLLSQNPKIKFSTVDFVVKKNDQDELYSVLSSNCVNKVMFTVDIERGYCNCASREKVCQHFLAVLEFLENDINTAFDGISMKSKEVFFSIAEGNSSTQNQPFAYSLHKENHLSEEDSVSYTLNDAQPSMSESSEDEFPLHISNKLQPSTSESLQHFVANMSTISKEVSKEDLDKAKSEALNQLTSIFRRIEENMYCNTSIFLPAVQKMIQNYHQFASTDSGLLASLLTFGCYSGTQSNPKQPKVKNRSRTSLSGVQPTAITKKKLSLCGKKRPLRPQGQQTQIKDSTSSNHLSPRKKKATHNLQQAGENAKRAKS